MGGASRGRPPRDGETRRYNGTVVDSYDNGVCDLRIDGLGDTIFEGVEPEQTGLGLWAPFVGQRVVVEERASSNAQDTPEIVGLDFDVFVDHPARRENAHVLVSPDGNVVVVLDGGTKSLEDGGDIDPALFLGRDAATEPAVLGLQLESFLESFLDDVETLKTTSQSMLGGLKAFAAAMTAATDPAVSAAATTLVNSLAPLDYSSLDFAGKKATIANHHSKLVFVAEE